MNRSRTIHVGFDVALIALFLAAILAPTCDLMVRDDAARGPAPELRLPAPKPDFPRDAISIYKFPARYEAHFNDTFGLRDHLLRANNLQKYYGLGISPAPGRLVGDDGWIFYAGESSMEIRRGAYPFTEDELKAWQSELDGRARVHEAAGRRYLFVLVPNKEAIYPERLPDSLQILGPTCMDQFVEWMHTRGHADVLDMRPAFLAAKADDTGPLDALYTAYGTHWTSRGAYTAYAAIVDHLAQGTPHRAALPFSEFDFLHYAEGPDTFAGNLYLTGILIQPGDALLRRLPNAVSVLEARTTFPQRLRTRSNESNLLPRAIFFHDSFGPFISHLLSQSFQMLDMAEGLYDRSTIDAQETKIVVEMFVERYLRVHQPLTRPEAPLNPLGGQFAGLEHVLFDLGLTPDAARAVDGLALTRTGDGGYRLARTSATDGLQVGPIRMPAAGSVRMLIELEAPTDASFDVMWRRLDGGTFTRLARTQILIGANREVRDIELPALGGDVELMLRPTAMQPPVILHRCIVRADQAP